MYYYHVGPPEGFVCQPAGAETLGKGRQVCLSPSERPALFPLKHVLRLHN